jgi:hypothetical protein
MRWLVSLGILSLWPETGLFCMDTNNLNSTMDRLAKRLANDHLTFFQDPFSFSWWMRGGEPGSPSDNLKMECNRGIITGTYIRVRFDPSRTPPLYSETFTGPVPLRRAADVLKSLFENSLFRGSGNGEQESGMRDARKESWVFRNPQIDLSKTFIEPFPEALETPRALCMHVAEALVQLRK